MWIRWGIILYFCCWRGYERNTVNRFNEDMERLQGKEFKQRIRKHILLEIQKTMFSDLQGIENQFHNLTLTIKNLVRQTMTQTQ